MTCFPPGTAYVKYKKRIKKRNIPPYKPYTFLIYPLILNWMFNDMYGQHFSYEAIVREKCLPDLYAFTVIV